MPVKSSLNCDSCDSNDLYDYRQQTQIMAIGRLMNGSWLSCLGAY